MSHFPENRRPAFERVVINRITESGFSEVEIRTECLAKSSDGTYILGDSEDIDVSEVLDESQKIIESVQRGDA